MALMQANGHAFGLVCPLQSLRSKAFISAQSAKRKNWPNRGITRCCSSSTFSMESRSPVVPTWAEPLFCPCNTQCSDGECEYLHVSDEQKSNACILPRGPGKLIVCAGPERSGSTWLFNALRFLLEGTNQRVHSYWINHITEAKLVKRGVGLQSDPAHILVKTHKWSKDWDPTRADLIVITERDICGVVNSYLRVGWKPKDMGYLKSFMKGYLEDHSCWKEVAHAVIHYEDISGVGGHELLRLHDLVHLLQCDGTDVGAISAKIRNLSVPSYGWPDPVTKLWPRHTKSSDQNFARRPSLSEEECKVLKELAAQFL